MHTIIFGCWLSAKSIVLQEERNVSTYSTMRLLAVGSYIHRIRCTHINYKPEGFKRDKQTMECFKIIVPLCRKRFFFYCQCSCSILVCVTTVPTKGYVCLFEIVTSFNTCKINMTKYGLRFWCYSHRHYIQYIRHGMYLMNSTRRSFLYFTFISSCNISNESIPNMTSWKWQSIYITLFSIQI